MTVTVKNLRATQQRLRRLGVEARDLQSAMVAISKKGEALARAATPVRDQSRARQNPSVPGGRLRAAVKASRSRNRAAVRVAGVPYARYVYFGAKAPAVPFLKIGVDRLLASGTVERDIVDGLNKAIRRSGLSR